MNVGLGQGWAMNVGLGQGWAMNVAMDYRPFLVHQGLGRDLQDLRSVQSVRDLIENYQHSQSSGDYQHRSDKKVTRRRVL